MTYQYLYQTKDNENRRGEIKAKNRAEAYAALRKRGIRPYRVIGDDPPNWRPWAISGAIFALFVAVAVLLFMIWRTPAATHPQKRAQLVGDSQMIAAGAASCWEGVFESALDRHLAAYAQPGWLLEPPELDDSVKATFRDALEQEMPRSSDETPEIRQLKNIVLQMREDMKTYLSSGGSVDDYLEFLSDRQQREFKTRETARETLEKAPPEIRRRAWLNLNARLNDLGIAPLPESALTL